MPMNTTFRGAGLDLAHSCRVMSHLLEDLARI